MEDQLATANNPWPVVIVVVALAIFIGAILGILGIVKLRRSKPGIRKLLDTGIICLVLLCGVSMWASFATKTQQITIVDAFCNIPGADTFAEIFPGTVSAKDEHGYVTTLRFPIAGYEGSPMKVLDAQGVPIDAWYSYYFCNPDQPFSEYVEGIYDQAQPIKVTTNYFGRIRSWQLLD